MTSCTPPRPSQHDKHNCHQAFALVSQSDGIDGACPSQCPSTAVTTTGSVFDTRPLKCSGAKGTRTPGLLHAIHRQHVHPRSSPQVTVPGGPYESARVRTGCGTFLLYSPGGPQQSRRVALLGIDHYAVAMKDAEGNGFGIN